MDTGAPGAPAAPRRRGRSTLLETIALLVLALLLAVVVKTFFVQSFYIPSESMEPGLRPDDRILVEKPSYWGEGTPRRGDVVVFKDPGGWLPPQDTPKLSAPEKLLAKVGLYPSGGHLVKRVVGLPGDTITCCNSAGQISINGSPIEESDVVAARPNGGGCDGPMPQGDRYCHWSAGPVPAGDLFVMGDNRGDSGDSSDHLCAPHDARCDPDGAYVPLDDVVGKVMALVWPPSRAGVIHTPDDFRAVPAP